jgi:hypothetical protein
MSPVFRYTLLWIFGSLIIVVGALGMVSGSYLDGQYLPSNPDAFYHARRILDAVMTHAPVIQFDSRIHAPEGSWITWPWGFDTLLAQITSWFGPYQSEAAASRVLMNIPVAAGPIAIALVVTLARQLRLSGFLSALLVVAFAALPLVFMLFAVGNVDHHFAELLWMLMTLSATMWFFADRDARAPGFVLAAVLGSAVAIQNGLFILELVPLAVGGWRWLRRESLPPPRAAWSFAGTLLVITLLACIPSEPWRRGFFEFYTLSWFHVYIAACTAVMTVLMALLPNNRRNFVILAVVALVGLVPIVASMDLASRFVSGGLESVLDVKEAMSPYRVYTVLGWELSTRFTSWLMWLAMPAMLLNIYWAWRSTDPRLQAFAIASVLFLALYQLQFRFGALGTLSLLMTPLLAAQWFGERVPRLARVLPVAALLLFAIAFIPTRLYWPVSFAPGGDPVYGRVRPALAPLAAACHERPGIVLATINDGHWVRFHTDCAVIGNVFLLTEQHAQKRRETEQLFALTPQELLAQRPDIRYVLLNFEFDILPPLGPGLPERPDLEEQRLHSPALMAALLGPPAAIPQQFHKFVEVGTPAGHPYMRLFEIVREPPAAH